MITSKIKIVHNVAGDGTKWNGTYFHNLEMENGDKINIGKKKRQEVGTELNYEITEQDGQSEFKKAKSVNPQSNGFKGGGKFADQEAILYQVCLKEAVHIIGIDGWGENNSVADKCKYVTDIAYQLAALSKPNIDKLKNK